MLALNSCAGTGSGHMNHAPCYHDPLTPPSTIRDGFCPPTRQLGAAGYQFLPHCSCRMRARSSANSWHELPSCSYRTSYGTAAAASRAEKRSRRRPSALISSAEGSGEVDEETKEETNEESENGGLSTLKEEKTEEKEESENGGLRMLHEEKPEEDVGKSILKLSLPGLGIVLSDPLMSLIDTGCVGQISSLQLASLGPNTLIFNFVFNVFGFLGTTTCNFMASTNVKFSTPQEKEELQMKAARVLSQALCLAAIIGIATAVLMEAFGPQLLRLMGATPDYMEPALTYLHIRALSVPAVLMLLVGHGACLGRQDAKTPLFINMVAAVLNFAGDFVFTLGAKWGVAGAAWATVAAQYVAVVLLFKALMTQSRDSVRANLKNSKDGSKGPSDFALELGWFGLPSPAILGEFYDMAVSLVLRCVLSMVIYTSIGKVAAAVGTLPLAAHQVAMQVFWFLSFFPEALSISAQSLIASDMKRNPERARTVARLLVRLSLGFGLGLALIVVAIHSFGTSLLTADVEVGRLVMSVTKQSMICSFLCAVTVVIEGIAIASGDLAYLSRMQLLSLVGVLIATISTHRAGWGLSGVWWCLVVYFGTRVAYHTVHILLNWDNHILVVVPVKVNAT